MTFPDQMTLAMAHPGSAAQPPNITRSGLARIADWLRTCADYRDAGARYEELNRLSDAELAQRGLSRETLARHVVRSAE